MEEKILEKLESIENKMDEKIDNLEKKLDERVEKMDIKIEDMDKKFDKLKEELTADIEKKILDHMFVFEEDYGKRLTIAYEDLTCRHATQESNSEQIANLEKREELNTAYVQSHESRIQELEKVCS